MQMHTLLQKTIPVKKALCILICVFFVFSLLPLLRIAKYDLPMGDDLLFGEGSSRAWEETHSISAVLKASIQKTAEVYETWQGTYFSAFLMCLHPGVFSLPLYAITPFLMLFALTAATLLFGYALLVRIFKCSRWDWVLLSMTAMLFSVQLLPSAKGGFFWFNSACLYTLSYCLALCMLSCALFALRVKTKMGAVFCGIFGVLLAFAVGGGAFSLLLPCAFLLAFLLLYCIRRHNKRAALVSGLILLVLAAGIAVSLAAPGNQVRTDYEHTNYGSQGSGAPAAILRSVVYGFSMLAEYSGPALLLFAAFCCAALYPAARALAARIRFCNPLLPLVLTFGLFCMQFTPSFYTLSSPGPDRLLNAAYFSIYWFYAANVFCLAGWLSPKLERAFGDAPLRALCSAPASLVRLGRIAAVTAALLLCVFALMQRSGGLSANPSVCAFRELDSSRARDHAAYMRSLLDEQAPKADRVDSELLP